MLLVETSANLGGADDWVACEVMRYSEKEVGKAKGRKWN